MLDLLLRALEHRAHGLELLIELTVSFTVYVSVMLYAFTRDE